MEAQALASDHATSLLSQLRHLYQRHLLTDLVLLTEDGYEFPVHKNVLVSLSGYFMGLLSSGTLSDERVCLQSKFRKDVKQQ